MSDKKNNTDFIAFLDDNDIKKEMYVEITELNPSYLTFITYSNNEITIPMTRVLKIKRKQKDE